MPTITVPTDYGTIQEAIDAAFALASSENVYTVYVLPGTYPEPGPISRGLHLRDYVNVEGANKNTCIITSNGDGAPQSAINWIGSKAKLSNFTIRALSGDKAALHMDHPSDWFTMENCILYHDDADGIAISSGGRAGQEITLTDIEITQGTFAMHGDVLSRALTDDIYLWRLTNVKAPNFTITDRVEYKDNKIVFANCEINSLTYQLSLFYYNANPDDPLFNQGYVRAGIYLYFGSGNSFDTENNVSWLWDVPGNRLLSINSEDRLLAINVEDRVMAINSEDRNFAIINEDRNLAINSEDRVLAVNA